MVKLYFSDFFGCSAKDLAAYGALDVSLVTDLPLFVDPFLIFNSKKPEYRQLHEEMIRYIRFLKEVSQTGPLPDGLIKSWFMFTEVKQNWLGYSLTGNNGRGLGPKFATALNSNLTTVFRNFGNEQITKGTHIEKLCLIKSGVGRDNISDFATNLIKKYLLEYTQTFTQQHIKPNLLKKINVNKVAFNWKTATWESEQFLLPWTGRDYVILSPEDMLTKDDTWISQSDLIHRFEHIASSVPNEQLRWNLDHYFRAALPRKQKDESPTQEEKTKAVVSVLEKFPEILDWYVKEREEDGVTAVRISKKKVEDTKTLFIDQVSQLVRNLEAGGFYKPSKDSYESAMERVVFLKKTIEDNDGYRFFYVDGEPVEREVDLQLIYRLTWFATPYEVDSEVNNGRGPVDYKISLGSADKSLVEFKLANNAKLEQNLEKQVEVYKKANSTDKAIKVIIYFSKSQLDRVTAILKRLDLDKDESIVLIDARRDNKVSASKVPGTK